jgi:putative transposase
MPCSLDLRKRVVDYVEKGGSVTHAAKIYQVGRATIYRWLGRENLAPTIVEHRNRKLDWKALEKDVEENPNDRLVTRAKKFRVHPSAISYALKKMKITRKKKNYVTKKEIEKRV